MIKSIRPDQIALSEGFKIAENCQSFGIQYDYGRHGASLSNGVEDSGHYEAFSCCSLNYLSSNEESFRSPKFSAFSTSSRITSSQSTFLDLSQSGGNSIDPVRKCSLRSESKTPHSHSGHTCQTEGSLSNKNSIGLAGFRQLSETSLPTSGRDSTFSGWCSDSTKENEVPTILNSSSVSINVGIVKNSTKVFSSGEEICSASRQDMEHSNQLVRSENYDRISVCQAVVSEDRRNVQTSGSNILNGKFNPKHNLMPECNSISCGDTDTSPRGTSGNTVLLNVKELNGGCETVTRIELRADTMVIYLPAHGSDVESEHELVICSTPEHAFSKESDQSVADILSKRSKPLSSNSQSNGESNHGRMEKKGVLRLLDSKLHCNNERNVSDSFEDLSDEVELEKGLISLSEEIATLEGRTLLDANPIQQVSSSASGLYYGPCRDYSEKLVEPMETQSLLSSPPNGLMTILAPCSQVTKRSHPPTRLRDDSNENLENGIIVGDLPCVSQQGKTSEAVDCIPVNVDKPSNVGEITGSVSTKKPHQNDCPDENSSSSNLLKEKEKGDDSVEGTPATSGAGPHLSFQTIGSNGMSSLMDLEPTVRIVCPSNRLKENKEGERSVPFAKDRHQLLGAVENSSPRRLMSESPRDCKKFGESTAGDTDFNKTEDAKASDDSAKNKCASPSNAEETPGKVSAGAHLSPPSVCFRRAMDTESTVTFIWSNKHVSHVKTASTSHRNVGRVVENVSENTLSSIKGVDTPNVSFQGKRPQQPESPELNRCLSLDRKRSHETNSNKIVTHRASTTNDSQVQTVKCIFPWRGYESAVSSKRSKICQLTQAVHFNARSSLELASGQRTEPCEIRPDAQFEMNGCSQSEISSEIVLHDPSDSCAIPESLHEAKCMMHFENPDEDDVRHLEHCETVARALELRVEQSLMIRSLPSESIAENIVNHIIGNCMCRQYLLGNVCSTDHCCLAHNVHQLNFNVPGHDLKTSFNVFSRWYHSNSKQPNFKVLLHLLSFLSRDFGDELLITILHFSSALLEVAQNFRRPLGIKLIEKLVHLVDLTKTSAISTIIMFNINNSTEESIITDLLNSLGVYEQEMGSLYESISCIWHFHRDYSFSQNVFFAMLKECLQEMPPHFGVTKDRMVVELLKYPRSILVKHFHLIERVLLKYYALNSFAAYKVRSVVHYGKIPVPDSNQKKGYSSSKVKSTGPINENWQYWDLNEERHKSMELVLSKMRLKCETEEEVCAPLELSTAPGFKMDELLGGTDTGDNLKLLASLSNYSVDDTSKYVSRMQNALQHRDYEQLGRIMMGETVRKSLDTYLDELHNMLTRLKKSEVPLVVYGFLKEISQSPSNKTTLWIRNKFTVLINSMVLVFYKSRDYKSALKLLKTLRMGGMNPLGLPPDGVDEQTFRIICSEIHFECRSVREAVKILLSGKSLNHARYNCTTILSHYVYPLERLVVKMLKYLVSTKRDPTFAMSLFRAVLAAQNNLFFPIDISVFYELVICYSFIKCKASCPLYDGVDLYVMVQRSCRHEVIFRPTTYRSLVVELVRAKAPNDILRRTLQLCLHFKVYPAFTPSLITLGTHLLEEEMYIYLLHSFQYLLAQDREAFLQLPCSVKLLQLPKPTRGQLPFLEDLKKVSTEISDAIKRFEEATKRIVGEVYPNLLMNFRSPSEFVIPTVGMETLANSLLKHKK